MKHSQARLRALSAHRAARLSGPETVEIIPHKAVNAIAVISITCCRLRDPYLCSNQIASAA